MKKSIFNKEQKYIKRCLELAKQGLGNTYPNPMVGCVIVHKDKIIGEGYHTSAGTAHAEINAINSVSDKELLKQSTLYVSLEPCSHWGKTPPCADKIIEMQIPHVVVATRDPSDKVAGKGIAKMQKAGIHVDENYLHSEAVELNKRFFTYHTKKRPYIILKFAKSEDNFIDIERTKETPIGPNWITGHTERALVHKWRAQEQAIIVGTNTVQKDDPELTTRLWYGKNPLRLYIDKNLSVKNSFQINNSKAKTICFNNIKSDTKKNTTYVKLEKTNNYLHQILSYLYKNNIQSLIIEGGKELLQSAIDSNLWDEALIFVGNKKFISGVSAPIINQPIKKTINFKNSKLFFYKNN